MFHDFLIHALILKFLNVFALNMLSLCCFPHCISHLPLYTLAPIPLATPPLTCNRLPASILVLKSPLPFTYCEIVSVCSLLQMSNTLLCLDSSFSWFHVDPTSARPCSFGNCVTFVCSIQPLSLFALLFFC